MGETRRLSGRNTPWILNLHPWVKFILESFKRFPILFTNVWDDPAIAIFWLRPWDGRLPSIEVVIAR